MLSSNQSRFIFALMLTFIILTPCVISVSNTNTSIAPKNTMELAAPTITGLTLYEYENGSVGETLEYDAFDANPKNYSVTVDGSDYDSGIWDGGSITVLLVYLYTRNLIDSIPQEFTFVVTVFNDAEESASITTTVSIIQDVTGPIIEQPANITYEEGSFGNEIQWNITESNPDFYNISRLSNEPSSNSTVMETGRSRLPKAGALSKSFIIEAIWEKVMRLKSPFMFSIALRITRLLGAIWIRRSFGIESATSFSFEYKRISS